MARRWADVAELIATQGLKGRFVARPVHGLPFLLDEGMPVSFVPPTLEGPRHVRVKSVQHCGSNEYLVEFSGVKNLDTAERIVGSHCLVALEDLPDNFDMLSANLADYLDGFEVRDVRQGLIGIVVDVEAMPTQDLLVVRTPDGAEALVPFVDDLIVELNPEEGFVSMDLPGGLL